MPSTAGQESFAAILRIETERAFAADKAAGAKARRDGFAFCDRPRRGAPALRCARFAWRGEESTFESLTRLRRALTPLFEAAAEAPPRAATVAIDCRVAAAAPRALFAALVGGARLPDCKSEKTPPPPDIALFGAADDEATRRALAAAEIDARANSLTRALARTPPNFLSPRVFVEIASELAAAHSSIETQILDRRALQKAGAGALLAVARGGGDCFVTRLSYRPPRAGKTSQRPLALVGKGITFDTGGYNLKPARHMRGMKTDMHGAAVALAAVLTAAESESPVAVDGWLALAENLISPAAYRPDEVARALTGKTIEIVHTDAEGRLALADAVALAARRRPRALVTYATLTGSMIAALGARMSGVFASDDEWLARALAASILLAASAFALFPRRQIIAKTSTAKSPTSRNAPPTAKPITFTPRFFCANFSPPRFRGCISISARRLAKAGSPPRPAKRPASARFGAQLCCDISPPKRGDSLSADFICVPVARIWRPRFGGL